MRTYPTGVLQNFANPAGPPDLGPVPPDSWRMFAEAQDANTALQMAESLAYKAIMAPAPGAMYGQFVYLSPNPDVQVYMLGGVAPAEDGSGPLLFQEFAGDIYDRYTKPKTQIDTYTEGQTPTLKCRAIGGIWGQLYWDAAA